MAEMEPNHEKQRATRQVDPGCGVNYPGLAVPLPGIMFRSAQNNLYF